MENVINENDEQIAFPPQMQKLYFFFQNSPNKEKLVIGLSHGKHITFHFGTKSKEFDIHVTYEQFPIGDSRRNKTLLKITYATAELLALQMETIFIDCLGRYFWGQRINLGKLHHHNCFLTKLSPDELKTEDWVILKKKKMKFAKSISIRKVLDLYLLPKEVPCSRTSPLYSVYKRKKGHSTYQGFIWYPPNMIGRNPFFVPVSSFRKMGREMLSELLKVTEEFGVTINKDVWDEFIQ